MIALLAPAIETGAAELGGNRLDARRQRTVALTERQSVEVIEMQDTAILIERGRYHASAAKYRACSPKRSTS